MPRKARIDAPGALHHIIVRGIKRKKIFKDDTDRINFLDRLGKVLPETGRNISAWKETDKSQSKKPFLLLGVMELGLTMTDLAPKLNILQPAVSMSTQRGERAASKNGYSLMDDQKFIILRACQKSEVFNYD